jgi:hypothetical protein
MHLKRFLRVLKKYTRERKISSHSGSFTKHADKGAAAAAASKDEILTRKYFFIIRRE